MNRREARARYLTIFLVAAPSAALCWVVFHAVYENLTIAVKAVGYVDSTTQIGIALGYVAMVGGTVLLAVIALWALIAYVRILSRDR
jgi:hypothetical protein